MPQDKVSTRKAHSSGFVIEGHRGYKGRYPENTLLSFEKALEAGAGQIELDIRVSADGTVFVIHDATVDRTTDGQGAVHHLMTEQIKALDAGSWFGPEFRGLTVPTLAETLDLLMGRCTLNVEIKTSGVPDEVWQRAVAGAVEDINKRDMWSAVLFMSFAPEALRFARSLQPRATLGLLDFEAAQVAVLKEIGGTVWHIHPTRITSELVAMARREGIQIYSGVSEESVGPLMELGVEVGATDFPGEVAAALAKWRGQ